MLEIVSIGAVTRSVAPLQTSWTRAERACAAHHSGNTYYDLLAAVPDDSATDRAGETGAGASETSALQPGFTLHL